VLPGMMDMSTQMNHWVALMAELEDTRVEIAQTIYKLHKEGKITNAFAKDQCIKLDDLYVEAAKYEKELAEDFKHYIHAGDRPDLGVAQKVTFKAKATAANVLTRMYIMYTVSAYKRSFRDRYMELGTRALTSMDDGIAICQDPKVVRMVRYALKVKKSADERWDEIQILHREKVHGNAFLVSLQQFVTSLALWGRNVGVPGMKAYLKVDEGLTKKLRGEYRKKFEASAPTEFHEAKSPGEKPRHPEPEA
jgi:hypothetical protein